MKQKMEGFYGVVFISVILLTQRFDVLLCIVTLPLLIFSLLQFTKQ